VGVEHKVIEELLDFQGRGGGNRVVVQVEEQVFLFFWVWTRGLSTLLSLKIVGNSKVEDWLALHKEAIEENTDLSINGVCFRI
jgi:hypothetical protein